jgi:8-oxo-dGTP pyrophosphatase MutT (NUDIX family)
VQRGADGSHPSSNPHEPLPWTLRSRHVAYENAWMTVWHDEVTRPDGSDGVYGVIHFPTPGVWIAAVEGDRVLLVGQHRHPLEGAWSWELPAGKVENGETSLAGAKRELAEETGYRARSWRELTEFAVVPGVSDMRGVCFEATELSAGVAAPEAIEDIKMRWVSLDEALALIDRGTVIDAISQVAIFRVAIDRGFTRELGSSRSPNIG